MFCGLGSRDTALSLGTKRGTCVAQRGKERKRIPSRDRWCILADSRNPFHAQMKAKWEGECVRSVCVIGVVGQGLRPVSFSTDKEGGRDPTSALSVQSMTRTRWETTLFIRWEVRSGHGPFYKTHITNHKCANLQNKQSLSVKGKRTEDVTVCRSDSDRVDVGPKTKERKEPVSVFIRFWWAASTWTHHLLPVNFRMNQVHLVGWLLVKSSVYSWLRLWLHVGEGICRSLWWELFGDRSFGTAPRKTRVFCLPTTLNSASFQCYSCLVLSIRKVTDGFLHYILFKLLNAQK